jgi:ADP-ribose diphosphatase
MLKKWQVQSSKQIADYYIFKVQENFSKSPRTGESHKFFVLKSKDWANIVAVTPDNKAVMVRQYRQGIDDITLEFPAGIVDQGTEDPEENIIRELQEETGYQAERVSLIGTVHANPAFMDNKCRTFLATNVVQMGAQNLDKKEDIEYEEIPISKIPQLIKSGKITHSLTIAAYYFYKAI